MIHSKKGHSNISIVTYPYPFWFKLVTIQLIVAPILFSDWFSSELLWT